jgi:hypothetical protein
VPPGTRAPSTLTAVFDPRRFAVLPVLLFTVALLTGCGGGDDGPQTKEGFISAADEVCSSLSGDFESSGSQQPGTAKEVADANHVLADLYGKLSDRLGKVRLPDKGAARTDAQAYIASVKRGEPLVKRLRAAADGFYAAAKGTDKQALSVAANTLRSSLDAFRAARARSDSLAVSYGLSLCGNLD